MNNNSIELPSEEENAKASKTLNILSFAAFVRMLGVSIIDLIIVRYVVDYLEGDAFLGGVAVGMFSIAQMCFQIPIAKLSDRIGRKKTLLIGLSIFATGTFLCGIATDPIQLMIFRFIQGSGAFISVIHAFIGDLFPSERRGRAMSRYTSGVTLGYAIGLPLGGFVASIIINLPFFVHFGLIVISWLVIYFFVDEDQSIHKQNENEKINYRKEIFTNKLFLMTTLVDCLSVFVFAALIVFIQTFAVSLGIELNIFSIIMIPLVLVMTCGFTIGGRYSDRIGRSNTIIIGLTIAGSMLLFQSFVNTAEGLVIVAAITVFGIGIAWPTIPALIIDSVSESCRAAGTSIYNTFRYTGNALGPIIFGYIISLYTLTPDPTPLEMAPGIRVTYLISGVIYFIAVLLVGGFVRKYEKEKQSIC